MFTFPENCKLVKLFHGAANAVASDVVSCKLAHRIWIVVFHSGASDTDLTLSLAEHTAVGESAVAITATFPIWVDDDAGTSSDIVVRQPDAASYMINTGEAPNQLVIFEWDPAKFTAGYDCLSLADSGGNSGNSVCAFAVIEPRYKSASLPAMITD